MSYILEALRKSEKERKQDETSVLQTIHAPRRVGPAGKDIFLSKPLRWILILLTLFVSTMGIMIWQGKLPIIQPEQQHTDTFERQTPAPLPDNPATNNSLSERQTTERLQQKKTRFPSQTESKLPPRETTGQEPDISRTIIIQEPSPLTLTQGKDDEITDIDRKVSDIHASTELPPSVQADIQRLKFAGHVYSEDRTRRMIMINNKILREGDGIDADFRLHEITRNGVILLYGTKRFRIDLF